MDTRKSVLAQTRDILMTHTQFLDWLFDWPDQNAPANSFTCTFHPHGHSITNLDQSDFVEQKHHSKMVFSSYLAVLV